MYAAPPRVNVDERNSGTECRGLHGSSCAAYHIHPGTKIIATRKPERLLEGKDYYVYVWFCPERETQRVETLR